ncbi:MAG: iron-containing alcohol dehydrogenase [Christensenellales bacterium]|jgi:alcohol dehydrogenase
MNQLYKIWCRTYQGVFRIASAILPWRVPELIEGENSITKLPAFIKEKGIDNVLIVTDKMIMSLGLADGLTKGLEKESIAYAIYDSTVPNPTIDNIEEALAVYKEKGCKAIIALGGGSPMDCAKIVGARVARPNKPVSKMKGLFKVLKSTPLFFAVPTTAGTGSEATLAAVISNSETHEKYPINDFSLIPNYAVLDPLLTVGLPKHITSTTGMDALTHAVEAYIGRSNTKFTENMAKAAITLIKENLKKAYDNGKDITARENMQLAAYYAGIAFTRAYVGYVHAIAHTMGGLYRTAHGLANSVLLPVVLEYYGESAHKRLAELAEHIGIEGTSDAEKARAFIAWIKELNKYMDIPEKLADVKSEDYELIAQRALKEANPLYPVPMLFEESDVYNILDQIIIE